MKRRVVWCAVIGILLMLMPLDNAFAGEHPSAEYHGFGPARKLEGHEKAVVARVNGRDITMAALMKGMETLARREFKSTADLTPKEAEETKKEALQSLIFFELAYEYAQKSGITVSDKEVDDVMKQLRKKLRTESGYRHYLEMNNYTDTTLREEIRKRLMVQKATASEVDAKAKYDEAAARKEYEKVKNKLFFVAERMEVDEIVFESGTDKGNAMKRADMARATLLKSGNDENFRQQYPDAYVKEFVVYKDKNKDAFEMLDGIKAGGASPVIERPEGFHIFFVKKRMPAEIIPFEQTVGWFKKKARENRMKEWYEEMKKQAKIEIMNDQTGKTAKGK